MSNLLSPCTIPTYIANLNSHQLSVGFARCTRSANYSWWYSVYYRKIELGYPHFPSEDELIHSILSSGDLQEHSKGGTLSLLAKFTMERPLLHKGEGLLPDLVELYQWLHKDIAHLLTHEEASSITIGQVVNFAKRNLNKEDGEHIWNLYQRVKTHCNQYMKLVRRTVGASNVTISISDHTPLLRLLTGSEFFECTIVLPHVVL